MLRPIILKQEEAVGQPINGHAIILTGFPELKNNRSTGAYRIAHVLREQGWDIEVIDYIMWMDSEQIYQILDAKINKDTRWIGIGYNWLADDKKAGSLIREIRARYSGLLFIVGGQFPFKENLNCDYYILGYGEKAVKVVLDYEFGSGPLPKSEPMFEGSYIDAYEDYPATPYKDYTITFADNDYMVPENHTTIELSRGCKFACKFCGFPFIGIKDSTAVEEEALYRELMTNYEHHGLAVYSIADDTLNDRIEKLVTLKNVVKKLDFIPDFKAFIRLDLLKAHPEHYELLAESRVWMQYYGIETFNKSAGKSIGKGMNSDLMKSLLLQMKEYMKANVGLYRGTASLIAGLPHEPIASIIETDKWFKDNWSDQSVLWWPLQIYKEKGILSAFGADMYKFGYSEITESDNIAVTNFMPANSITEIKWKNEHTNIYECQKIVAGFQDRIQYLDAFSTARYLSMYNQDYEKVLSIRRKVYPSIDTMDYRKRSLKLAREYTAKKLNSIKIDKI